MGIWGHPLSRYAKFSKKLTFLTYVCIRGLVFQKILSTYLMDDPYRKSFDVSSSFGMS